MRDGCLLADNVNDEALVIALQMFEDLLLELTFRRVGMSTRNDGEAKSGGIDYSTKSGFTSR
jgi:hypothetical protein